MNAGIIFITGNRVLAGIKRNGYLGGIGGKTEPGETPRLTAVRETLEEIFGVFDLEVAKRLSKELDLKSIYRQPNYHLFMLPMSNLTYIARRLNNSQSISTIYPEKIPVSVSGILSQFQPTGEFLGLQQLNIHDYPFKRAKIDKYFLEDIARFI